MTTTLYRMPVRASMSARLDGVSVCVSRPALTARPAREPCEVSIRNRTSLSASIPLAATCNDMASAPIVAPPPLFELYCTLIGPFPKRLATTCAAPEGHGAIKITGSPFKTFDEAEAACDAMLKHLMSED